MLLLFLISHDCSFLPSLLFLYYSISLFLFFFFFNDTATTEIYTLSLHDALPISERACRSGRRSMRPGSPPDSTNPRDRKSTRLNSSHITISYAVFCLKKKKNKKKRQKH